MSKYYHEISLEQAQPLTDKKVAFGDIWRSEESYAGRSSQKLNSRWIWVAHAILLSISLGSLALSFDVLSLTPIEPMINTYSPAQSAVKYEIQNFDLPPVSKGPYVGKGPEVDAAWDYITSSIGDTMVSREEMIKMKLDPEDALEITDPETGERGYRVAIEMFHQLHCLNLLRQTSYKKHYKPPGGDAAASKHELRHHMDHCIDTLRQVIMCRGDVDMFAFRLPLGEDKPRPDYSSTPRVCRNFESIRKWAVDHTVQRGEDEPDH